MWAKQSTAATLIVGPILDSAGAEYTGAVIGDLSISKNGGTLTALASAATLTHIANGQYTLVLTTGNLDTLGRLQITCNKSTYQMPPIGLVVVPAMVFDSMVLGTDVLQGDTVQIGGDTQSATDLKDFADAGYDPATNKVQGVVLVDTTTANSDMRGTDNAALAATALSTATWTGTLATNLITTNTTVAANLDATVSSRLASSSYASAPSAAANATAVRSELTLELGRIDAAISTRSTYAGGDTAGVTTLLTRIGSTITITAGAVTAVLDSAVGTQITNIENASGYLLAVLAGACADPQTASETYAITVFGSTFTVDMAGQTSTGTRTAPTLTKT